jgi:MarR family transcriptional regulator, transcriptional regulator for hemolysin
MRASRNWKRRAGEALGSLDLSESTAWALINIHRLGDRVRQITVADAIGIEGPSFVRLLDQLCAAGLVERREDQEDRRAKTLHLTPAGVDLTVRAEALLHDARRDILAGVSKAELETCLRVFRAIEGPEANVSQDRARPAK